MKNYFIFAAVLFSCVLFKSSHVEARHSRSSFSLSFCQTSPTYYCPPAQPVYYAPQPQVVYYTPAPQPQPQVVYTQAAPVYYQPAPYYVTPVVVRPAPRPCFQSRIGFGFGFGR